MKTFTKTSRSIIAALLAGGALLAAGGASAQERVIVERGPGPVVYGEPHMTPVGVSINIGWHGDRYYDGHRYWDHDDGCAIIRATMIRVTTVATNIVRLRATNSRMTAPLLTA